MGKGDRKYSDDAAVQAMRRAFETVPITGNIVIGEGERDEAPMLYIGERVGSPPLDGREHPAVDIAVDPLEGTNLCATGASNAIAVLAASEPGGLLHAPDCYMEKIVAGPACRGALDLDAPVSQNLKSIARRLDRDVRREGARIRLIGDGDLSAAIAVAVRGNGVHAVMGIGGAPEGVLAAAAMRCLHGEMVGRLVIDRPELEERVLRMGIKNPERIYTAGDLAMGTHIIFAACGVTDGALLRGVRFFGEGYRTHTLLMTSSNNSVKFIDAVHMTRKPGPRGVRLY
jgi:fructose-1,6-bisphosphatase/sedoheptulose 1,7-bisphosphatase-like protein